MLLIRWVLMLLGATIAATLALLAGAAVAIALLLLAK